MSTKPLIGITGHFEDNNNKYYLDQEYVDAVASAGGIPLVIPIFSNASRYLDIIDGIIISGGGINPLPKNVLKQKELPTLQQQNPKRYGFEEYLLKLSALKKIPIIGICRGAQMITEVFGGRVSVSNPELKEQKVLHNQKQEKHFPSHKITVGPGVIRSILRDSKVMVNSLHRQMILEVPDDFIVSARADDKVIEAFESKDGRVLGFQFHPEMLDGPRFKKVFSYFINLCKKDMQKQRKLFKHSR